MRAGRETSSCAVVWVAATMLALSKLVAADSGTWVDDTSGNWSDTNNWSGGVVADGAGYTADFSAVDIVADRTVELDTPRIIGNLIFGDTDTGTPAAWMLNGVGPNVFGFENDTSALAITVTDGIQASMSAAATGTGTDGGDGNKILKLGDGKLTLSGPITLVGDVNTGLNAYLSVDGGGELEVKGYVQAASALQSNRGNGTSTVGAGSPGNTLTIAAPGKVYAGGITIGGSTFGNNAVVISTPGTQTAPSYRLAGNGAQLNMGVSSSSNTLTISNGAYLYTTQGGGTMTWTLGTNPGADGNRILISGAGSTMDRTGGTGSAVNVGSGGADNSITVQAGGSLFPRRLAIGRGGGSNNYARVTGAGSLVSAGTDSNQSFGIGSDKAIDVNATIGGDGNYLRIENGGAVTFSGNANRGYNIGAVNGADDNYVVVDGLGSSFTMLEGQPLAIGGATGSNNGNHYITDSTASGNYLAVINGARTFQNSVYVMGNSDGLGTGSRFVLGNGINIATPSEASVGESTGNVMYQPGVTLYNSYSRLIIDNGRLIARAAGALVSGPGAVSNAGPAFVSTDYTNTIDSVVIGPGSLTKEGSGTLTLTATNTFHGDTIVSGGILGLDVPSLSDEADVYLVTGAKMDLNFGGTDVIRQLYVDGVAQGGGTYGAGKRLSSFFIGAGPGLLKVFGVVGPTLIVR